MLDTEKTPEQYVGSTTTAHSDEIYPKLSLEPAFFLFILILSIFLGEIVIMVGLPYLVPPNIYSGSVIDALLLVIIIFPILYFFSFRPLQLYVAELKRMQEEIRRTKERYSSLVESTDDSIYLVNRDYKYLFMNAKHLARLGLSEGQWKEYAYGDLHSLEGTKDFEKKVDQVFLTGKSIQQEHKSHRDSRHFLRTFSPVKDPFGNVEAVTVVSKDVTTIK